MSPEDPRMTSLTSNRASNAPSELRVRLTRDAVLAAYINEISEHARPSGAGARRETSASRVYPQSGVARSNQQHPEGAMPKARDHGYGLLVRRRDRPQR